MGPDGPEQREAYEQERSWAEDREFDKYEDRADGELMDCHRNEYGEIIPELITVIPVNTLEELAEKMLKRISEKT